MPTFSVSKDTLYEMEFLGPCPLVGDKISSSEFAFGYEDYFFFCLQNFPIIVVDCQTKVKTETEVTLLPYEEGSNIFAHYTRKGAYDLSRGQAIFVIEYINISAGRYGDSDILQVVSRRLHPSGLYDPDGELIAFYYQKRGKNKRNSIKTKPTFHGHMQRSFI